MNNTVCLTTHMSKSCFKCITANEENINSPFNIKHRTIFCLGGSNIRVWNSNRKGENFGVRIVNVTHYIKCHNTV